MHNVTSSLWVFPVEPCTGESLSHFLGRFCRENHASLTQLGKKTSLGAAIGRWAKFHLNPPPTQDQIMVLAQLLRIEPEQLQLMLPPSGVGMKHEPIRLCAACYSEEPYHQLAWQFKSTSLCDRHQLYLLSECPECKARFATPFEWERGYCRRCLLPFNAMSHSQRKSGARHPLRKE